MADKVTLPERRSVYFDSAHDVKAAGQHDSPAPFAARLRLRSAGRHCHTQIYK